VLGARIRKPDSDGLKGQRFPSKRPYTSPRLVSGNFRNRNPADGYTAASFWLIRSARFTPRNFTGATLSLAVLHRRAVLFPTYSENLW
jgi:hypothetical protein